MNKATKVLTLHGLRGGTGTTSLAAMLGDSLHRQGGKVLLIDVNPADMLRLMFNVPHQDQRGWRLASDLSRNWNEQAYAVAPGLYLLPHGRGYDTQQRHTVHATPDWGAMLDSLAEPLDWIIFDLPAAPVPPLLLARSNLDLTLAMADTGCHVLLHQDGLRPGTHLAVTQYDPSRTLSSDVLLTWRHSYASQLIPVLMHRDESVHEAMALKAPVTQAYPDCTASNDAHSLATWVQAHLRGTP